MFNHSTRVTNETSCAISISAVHTIGEAFRFHSERDGTISEILYAVAVSPHELDQLDRLSEMVTTHLLIDNIAHLWMLSSYKRLDTNKERPWSVFIKLDISEDPHSAGMKELLAAVERAPKIELRGFHVQSYAPPMHTFGHNVCTTEKRFSETTTLHSDFGKDIILTISYRTSENM